MKKGDYIMKKIFCLLVSFFIILVIFPVLAFSQTWYEVTSLGTTQDLYSVFFLNDGNGWISADSCLAFKTVDGGDTWQRIYIAPSTDSAYPIRDIQFVTSDTGFAAGDSGCVYVTTDAGATWSSRDSTITKFAHINIYALHFKSGFEGWIVGDKGNISHTTDGGNSWTLQTISTQSLNGIQFISNNGWIVGDLGEMYNTVDNGSTWQLVGDTLTTTSRFGLAFIDPTSGWIAGGSNPYIAKTTDGGNFWIGQSGPTQTMFAIAMKDNNEGWVGGENGEILYTLNGGGTWTADNTGMGGFAGRIRGIDIIPSGRVWAVCYTGKIFATYAGAPPPPSIYHHPYFYPMNRRAVAIGDTMRFTLTAIEPDGDPMSWSANNLPPGAMFNPGTQEFTWIPTMNEANGYWWVDFTVSDGTGNAIMKQVEVSAVVNGWYPVQATDNYPFISEILFMSDNEGWACGYSGMILHTDNSGAVWDWQPVPDGRDFFDIDFVDFNNGWVCGVHVAPPSTVATMVPLRPTAQPLVAFTNSIPNSISVVPLF